MYQHYREGDVIMDYGRSISDDATHRIEGHGESDGMDENGKEILLYYLGSSESCSMAYSCCVEAKKSRIRAVAEDDVELIGIPHVKLDEWLLHIPGLEELYFSGLQRPVHQMLKSIESIAFHKLDEHLVSYLKKQNFPVQVLSNHLIPDRGWAWPLHIMVTSQGCSNNWRIIKRSSLYRNEIKILKRPLNVFRSFGYGPGLESQFP